MYQTTSNILGTQSQWWDQDNTFDECVEIQKYDGWGIEDRGGLLPLSV